MITIRSKYLAEVIKWSKINGIKDISLSDIFTSGIETNLYFIPNKLKDKFNNDLYFTLLKK